MEEGQDASLIDDNKKLITLILGLHYLAVFLSNEHKGTLHMVSQAAECFFLLGLFSDTAAASAACNNALVPFCTEHRKSLLWFALLCNTELESS